MTVSNFLCDNCQCGDEVLSAWRRWMLCQHCYGTQARADVERAELVSRLEPLFWRHAAMPGPVTREGVWAIMMTMVVDAPWPRADLLTSLEEDADQMTALATQGDFGFAAVARAILGKCSDDVKAGLPSFAKQYLAAIDGAA